MHSESALVGLRPPSRHRAAMSLPSSRFRLGPNLVLEQRMSAHFWPASSGTTLPRNLFSWPCPRGIRCCSCRSSMKSSAQECVSKSERNRQKLIAQDSAFANQPSHNATAGREATADRRQSTRLRQGYGVASRSPIEFKNQELRALWLRVVPSRRALAGKTFPVRIDRPVEAIPRDIRR